VVAAKKKSKIKQVEADSVEESEEDIPRHFPKSELTATELEKLYDDSSGRILQERNDFFLPQIRDFVQKKRWVNLRPEYQRRRRWDQSKQSRLIESLLMNVPVPPIFLYETDLSRYEVMDGQQRLISIIDFYDNKLELKRLTAWSALNGLRFNELPDRIKRAFDRRRISAVILLAESAAPQEVLFADIRREVFERLNTGGTALNAQELRNSIFGGPFNDLLVQLAKGRLFCEMWGIPPHNNALSEELQNNELFKQMGDCQIVLRFFSFREKEYVSGSVKNMLDSCMKRNQSADGKKIRFFKNLFETRLEFVNEIFGKGAFRLPDSMNGRLSRPLFDALMIASDRQWSSAASLKRKKVRVRAALRSLIENPRNYAVIVARANTAKAVLRRIALVERALQSVL
jgi:Protein of unknown function DUF262